MTLEEAKTILSDAVDNGYYISFADKGPGVLARNRLKAMEVALNYIENDSIPKEKIKEIIYPTPENYVPIEVQTSDMYSKLQELLGE